MSKYTPGGKPHRILAFAARGRTTRNEIAVVIRGPNQSMDGARTRAFHQVNHLCSQGLLWSDGEAVAITAAGRAELAALGPVQDLENYGAPTVRLFPRKEAA